MKKSKAILLYSCFITALSVAIKSSMAGTTTIDFNACANSTSCNIFSVADQGSNTLCNGVKIYSEYGSPVYYTKNGTRTLLLQGQSNLKGDGINIEYAFKKNYSYDIIVTSAIGPNANIPLGNYPEYQVSLNNSATGSFDHCGIGNALGIGDYPIGFKEIVVSPTQSKRSSFTLNRGSNYSYLNIRSYGMNGYSALTDLLIYKIEIIETKLQFNYPGSFIVACQTPVNNTFSVSNTYGIFGNINYVWNVGSGWIYNGNPTPVTVNSSSNLISLYSDVDPNNRPQNVNVTVYVDGVLYGSYGCNIIYTTPRPNFYIEGPTTICNSPQTYNMNLPSNAYVISWTKDNNLVTLTSNGNSCTLTPIPNTVSGSVALNATVQTPCGTFSYSFGIDKGYPPAPMNISSTIEDLNNIPLHSYVEITAEGASTGGIYSYYWSVGAGRIVSGQGMQTIGVFVTGQGGKYFTASVQLQNACGKGAPLVLRGTIGNNFYSATDDLFNIAKDKKLEINVHPNPTTGIIRISNLDFDERKEIRIINLLGGIVRSITTSEVEKNIDINELPNGIYLIQIITDKETITKKVLKI